MLMKKLNLGVITLQALRMPPLNPTDGRKTKLLKSGPRVCRAEIWEISSILVSCQHTTSIQDEATRFQTVAY
jgi:hypothetical protein